jgi:hypothetical protein
MKKLAYLSALCLFLFSTSCNSDDDDNQQMDQIIVTSDLIVGKWYFVDIVVNGLSIPYDDHEDCGKDYIEFKDNGTLWQIDVWDCEEDAEQIATYSISDGNLFIEGELIDVLALSSNILSIKAEEDYDDDGNLDEIISNFDR